MFLEEKYDIPIKKQECTKFILKALPGYLDLKERKKLKEQIIEIRLLSQMADTTIPNLENENYIYKTIMVVEFKVIDIKKVITFIEIIHKLFKAPTIIKITDERENYLYSFSRKRLSKLDKNEIVIDDIVTSQIFNTISNIKLKEGYENIIQNRINKNNKYEYYFELLLKTLIFTNKNILDDEIYKRIINSNIYYNIEKMEELFQNISQLITLKQEYNKSIIMADKMRLNKDIEEIKEKI